MTSKIKISIIVAASCATMAAYMAVQFLWDALTYVWERDAPK